jgi:hypothetical protein
MHTTDELRDVLRELADAAPQTVPLPGDPDEVLPALKRPRHTSRLVRFGAPALAAATVAGVVVAGVTLTSGAHHRATKPATSPKPTPTPAHLAVPSWFTTTVFDVKGLTGATVGGVGVDGASQQRQVSFDGFRTDSQLGIVRVWAPGRWTPSRPADAQDVTVNGKPGFYGKIPTQWDGGKGRAVGLTWQYAPGAWAAVMRQTAASKTALLRIATAVRTGQHIPARLPFKLSGLPAGGKLDTLEWRLGAGRQGAGGGLQISYPGRHGVLVISVDPLSAGEFGKPTTIGGKRVYQDGKVLEIAGPGVSRAILEPTTPDYSRDIDLFTPAETKSIVAGLTFAPNVKDPSTWFDAASALP